MTMDELIEEAAEAHAADVLEKARDVMRGMSREERAALLREFYSMGERTEGVECTIGGT
jgi:hypothetical protein